MNEEIPRLDGSKFLGPLHKAAELIAYRLEKERIPESNLSPEQNGRSRAVLASLLRTSMLHFSAGWFFVADQTREAVGWRKEYVLSLSLQARTNLEILFNVILLLEDLPSRVPTFEKHGWREAAIDFQIYQADFLAEGGRKADWAHGMSESLEMGRGLFRITSKQAENPSSIPVWPTPGKMWSFGLNSALPDVQLPESRRFLKYIYFRYCKPLSGGVHANGYGLMRTGSLSVLHMLSSESRSLAREEAFPKIMSQRVAELSVFLLCTACELQRLTGAVDSDIEARLLGVWIELCKVEGLRDLFDLRYQKFYPYPIVGS